MDREEQRKRGFAGKEPGLVSGGGQRGLLVWEEERWGREREPGREPRQLQARVRRELVQGREPHQLQARERREREQGREPHQLQARERREREQGREPRQLQARERREREPGHRPVLPWGRRANGSRGTWDRFHHPVWVVHPPWG